MMRDEDFFPAGRLWLVVGIAGVEPEERENPGRKLQIDAVIDRMELEMLGIRP